jgi:hypothetical protein
MRLQQESLLNPLPIKASTPAMTPEQKKQNLRLGLILASVAIVFFLGFMVKMLVLTGQ